MSKDPELISIFKLYVRRGKLPDISPQDAMWTTFEMDLREPSPMLTKPLDLAKFVATSITFMTHIRQISVFVDQHRLFSVTKASGLSESLRWPGKLKNESPLRYMRMASVSSQRVLSTLLIMHFIDLIILQSHRNHGVCYSLGLCLWLRLYCGTREDYCQSKASAGLLRQPELVRIFPWERPSSTSR